MDYIKQLLEWRTHIDVLEKFRMRDKYEMTDNDDWSTDILCETAWIHVDKEQYLWCNKNSDEFIKGFLKPENIAQEEKTDNIEQNIS